MTQTSVQNQHRLIRVLSACAQAGAEIVMALIFVILLTVVLALSVPSLLADRQLFQLDGRITLHFNDHDSGRMAQIEAALPQLLPRRSTFEVFESDHEETAAAAQSLTVDISYATPLGYLNFGTLAPSVLDSLDPPAQIQGFSWTMVDVRGPPWLLVAVWLHLAMIPWLMIRLWWMPRDAAPARPVWPRQGNTVRVMAFSAGAGLILAVVVSLSFGIGEALGLLEFSEEMPTLETFGIQRETLWLGALLVGLVGAVEEVLFRGVLLRRFVQKGLPWFGVIACALVFTLAHASYFSWYSGNIAYAMVIYLAGLGLGWLTLRTGTWLHAAVLHAAYNFMIIMLFLIEA